MGGYSRALLARLSVAASEEDIEPVLVDLIARGAAAWPQLPVPGEALVAQLAGGHRGEPVVDWLRAVHAADLQLAAACALRVPGAVEVFEKELMSKVGMVLAANRTLPAVADDVRQMIREKLFVAPAGQPARISAYTGRGSLLNWLRVITLRAAVDYYRGSAEDPKGSGSSRRIPTGDDPELDYIKEHYRSAFKQAFHAAVAGLDGEQRTMLRVHYVDGATLDETAALFRISRATLVRRIAEARESIVESARRLLGGRLEIDPAEFESLLRLLRSRLDLSLSRVLGALDPAE